LAGETPANLPIIMSVWISGCLTDLLQRSIQLILRQLNIASFTDKLLSIGDNPFNESLDDPGRLALGNQVENARWWGWVLASGDGLNGFLLGFKQLVCIRLAISIDVDRYGGRPGDR
jgi:hypothetical protein